jgi:hypothetical protein
LFSFRNGTTLLEITGRIHATVGVARLAKQKEHPNCRMLLV